MSQNKILAFNWKTNPNSFSQALGLFKSYKSQFELLEAWDVIVFPPFVYLYSLMGIVKRGEINATIGAQDVSEFDSGAHTSQISGPMIADLGCKSVLIGHSETRSELLTTSFDAAHKIEAALRNQLLPILCVGFEPQIDGENINYEELKEQVVTALEPNIENLSKLDQTIIAYEPTWAIGTGKAPTVEIIEEVIDFILNTVESSFGKELSQKTRVIYGGSVNETNIAEFAKSDKIAGFLIGGASLDPIKVTNIINSLI